MRTVITRIDQLTSLYSTQRIEAILYDRKFPIFMKVRFPGVIYYELDLENYDFTCEKNEFGDLIYTCKKRGETWKRN